MTFRHLLRVKSGFFGFGIVPQSKTRPKAKTKPNTTMTPELKIIISDLFRRTNNAQSEVVRLEVAIAAAEHLAPEWRQASEEMEKAFRSLGRVKDYLRQGTARLLNEQPEP